MKIYTKTGDAGTTSLVGGTRVAKTDLRLDAYGTIDEAMAQIAFLRDNMDASEVDFTELRDDLLHVLRSLMTASAEVACEPESSKQVPHIGRDEIEYLEMRIDYLTRELPKIDKFTIPGGHPLVSLAHVARTVTRRTERRVIAASEVYPISPDVLKYLNRLSDYLYTLGRKLTNALSVEEILWIPNEK